MRGQEEQLLKDALKTIFEDYDLKDQYGRPTKLINYGINPGSLRVTLHGLPIEPLVYWLDGILVRGCEGHYPRPIGWELLGDQPCDFDPMLRKIPTMANGGMFWTSTCKEGC